MSVRDLSIDGPAGVHLGGQALNTELREMFQALWDSRDHSDIALKAQSKEFKAHKLLLFAHCAYFKDVQDFDKTSEILLDLDPDVLHSILYYLYHGDLDLAVPDVQPILEAAEYLGISALKKDCNYALLYNTEITPENCIMLLIASHESNDEGWFSKCLQGALEYFPMIVHESDLKQIPYECLRLYLSHPDLNVLCEDERLSACLAWVKAERRERTKYLPDLLDLLPLQDMHAHFLRLVMKDAVISEQEEVKSKLQRVLDTATQAGTDDHSAPPKKKGPRREQVPSLDQQTWLITLGTVSFRDDKPQETIQEMQAVFLDDKGTLVSLGMVGSDEVRPGVKLCAQGNTVYVAGLGEGLDEVWRVTVSASKITKQQKYVLLIECYYID